MFSRLRKDLEEAAIQQEATILSLKKKHQDAIAEMSEQIDQLNKLKTKAETEKALWSKIKKKLFGNSTIFKTSFHDKAQLKVYFILSWIYSMTTLLTHTVAHSTKPSFRPKTNNQPLKKFLNLALSWGKVVKNGKILTFKLNFLCQKLSESF